MRVFAVIQASLVVCAALAAHAQAMDKPAPATAEQVAAWVRQLDADEFAVREEATARLAESGKLGIEHLASAGLADKNLEVVSRAVHVLQELALSEDLDTEEAAREVLKTLARSTKNPSAARRAEGTLATLNQMRQGRSIEELQRLGANVVVTTKQIGPVLVHEVPTVEVGENFTGTAKDLRRLKHLQDVQLVELSGQQITDEALQQLRGMANVTYLTIKRAKITDEGIAALDELPRLQHLIIMYSPISDSAIDKLAGIKTLTELRLYGTKMTPQGVARVGEALGVKVDYRRGAFLGIGCQPVGRGCEVTVVHPQSAAAKAGMQPGDIILKFAGEPVVDFEGLTALISRHSAGGKVTVELLRDAEPMEMEVSLGEWE